MFSGLWKAELLVELLDGAGIHTDNISPCYGSQRQEKILCLRRAEHAKLRAGDDLIHMEIYRAVRRHPAGKILQKEAPGGFPPEVFGGRVVKMRAEGHSEGTRPRQRRQGTERFDGMAEHVQRKNFLSLNKDPSSSGASKE